MRSGKRQALVKPVGAFYNEEESGVCFTRIRIMIKKQRRVWLMKKKKWCCAGMAMIFLLWALAGCGAAGRDGGDANGTENGAQGSDANGTGNGAQGSDMSGTEGGTQGGGGANSAGTEGGGQDGGVSGAETDAQDGSAADGAGTEAQGGMQAPPTDYVSEELYASADQWGSCDDAALAAVMRKAENGEPVTIACIGGSITQGTISNGSDDREVAGKKCYADIYFSWWEQTFPETDFTFINAGIGATDSYIGVHRVQKDVLDFEPDLVLVEFSVNDADSLTFKTTYDNLVRRILLSDNHPAVMLLFMGQTNGATAQGSHVLVGFNYKLPMVSYASLIQDMMEQEVYTEKQLSGDTVHPSALGHAITGEILWKYLNAVYVQRDELPEPQEFAMDAVTRDVYLNASILDSETVTPLDPGSFEESSKFQPFPNDWTCESGEGGILFEASFQRLGILYHRTVDGLSGQFDVLVDGERVATLNADFTGGWGNCAEAREVFAGDAVETHTVEIRKAPDSTGDVFTILGLMTAG
ncbi:MAG: SGNH/GDSL hydrolase family protein [bacterium]|nr:SGNH/GDSL hydrolase family protein [bacterium]